MLVPSLALFLVLVFVLLNFDVMAFVLFYYILFLCFVLSLRILFSSNERREWIQLGREVGRNWEE
jgi:cell division protein FtsW (lipid II flippase)